MQTRGQNTSPVVLFIRLTRPFFLLGGILMYALGVGIAHYLGASIDWPVYWLGQGCVTLLQLSAQYLNEYFDLIADADNPNRTPFTGGSGTGREGAIRRNIPLMAAASTLTVGAVLTVLLIANGRINQSSGLILALAYAGSIFYSVPPLRLVGSGYGELVASILVANLVPVFAFILQYGDLHRLVAMATFPLTALHIAMLIGFSLPDYSNDLKFGKRTLLIRLGWQRGMLIHNYLIILAYLILAIAVLQGMPWRLAWPGFLTLPVGGFQIYQMNRIAAGAPARWTPLTFNAIATFGLTAYLLAFAFWTA